jgi:uncharacterized protein
MLITLLDLEREPVPLNAVIPPRAIDYGADAAQIGPVSVLGQAELIREHRGPKLVIEDIRARARWSGDFEVPCARCLEPVRHALGADFDLLFRPLGADAPPGVPGEPLRRSEGSAERSLTAPETEIGYYQEEGLVLEDVLREQVLLALPVRSLCRQDCKGLCPRCGRNLNSDPCACQEQPSDARWSALSDLRSRLEPR